MREGRKAAEDEAAKQRHLRKRIKVPYWSHIFFFSFQYFLSHTSVRVSAVTALVTSQRDNLHSCVFRAPETAHLECQALFHYLATRGTQNLSYKMAGSMAEAGRFRGANKKEKHEHTHTHRH